MGGNLWPLILNDQPQLERERTWTVPQHRRDQTVEAIASAAIRRCRSIRTNNRSMGEPQGALAIPRAATVYLEHVATLANGPLILPVREAVAVFSARRRLLLRLRLRIFAGRSRAPKSYEWHLKPSRSSLRPSPRTAASRHKRPVASTFLEIPDYSVDINYTLAIERRGGRGGGGPPMPVRPIDKGQRPWNKGLLVGQKKPLEPKHVWSIRVRLEVARSRRDLVIFNLAIDSKLRACDLVKLRLDDICSGAKVRHRATIVQKKTGRPVQFEIKEQSRTSVEAWLPLLRTTGSRYLFPHISIRQYARLVHRWVESIGLESAFYGTHSMRRTKAAQIYRKTGNLRAVQLLLGHTKLESTVRYLGIEVDDALNIGEQIEL
jgi:integrase